MHVRQMQIHGASENLSTCSTCSHSCYWPLFWPAYLVDTVMVTDILDILITMDTTANSMAVLDIMDMAMVVITIIRDRLLKKEV
ncbi:hypothetical protein TNIN_268541 [Trichonephila inaurata madagascariensis]|uniref:Uncharacterized protein n=1 Tax=Trichonephila inaurata madagascariensis TaxID=2747483 RepID=A0A8X7CRX7_9ARAC|nr:hypothetical protein TNIN_268541 [Trichonephila inaurata madagascariensis]